MSALSISIAGTNTTITPALQEAVNAAFERLQAHSVKPCHAHVVLHVDGQDHKADAQITGWGDPLVASATSPNMYTSIKKLASLLDRQWRKRKTSTLSQRKGATALKKTV